MWLIHELSMRVMIPVLKKREQMTYKIIDQISIKIDCGHIEEELPA